MIDTPNAILVHGKPNRARYEAPGSLDPSDSHWIPWAKHLLNVAGIRSNAPDMPSPCEPDYPDWFREFNRYDVNEKTILVGLSAGAGFLLRYLSENDDVVVDKLLLVAPWIDPDRNYGDFGEFVIDPTMQERCVGGIAVFYSSEDDDQVTRSLEMVRAALPRARYRDIPRYGHFMLGNKMTSPEFPELLEELL